MNDLSRAHLDFYGSKVLEPTLADVIMAIAADTTLPAMKRRHWVTSLNSIARAIGRPPESILCRLNSLRLHIARLNAAPLGWTQKTLANHKSNVRATVNHYMKAQGVPRRGQPLLPVWKLLIASITEKKPRLLLGPLARYCSVRSLPPTAVTDELVLDFFVHRDATGSLRPGVALTRELAKAWNFCVHSVPGWPGRVLTLPEVMVRTSGPDWNEFPDGLRADVETYLSDLTKRHHTASGRRRSGCKASTCTTRRRELVAFARTAVESGIPIDSLTSLVSLLAPDVVTRTFETYLDRNGERPKGYTIDIAWKLHAIAKAIDAPAKTIAHLDDIRDSLEQDRGQVLTEKNLTVIRGILMTDVWSRVLELPEKLMTEAYRHLKRSPQKAASLAALALEIQLLTRAPVRIGNLMSIRLGFNLHRTGGPGSNYRLHFPDFDVKNRVDLDFPMSASTTAMIDRFIHDFRQLLGDGHRGDWLFPGEDGKHRCCPHASTSIASRLERDVGLRVTAHQFRHAAAATILKARPGDYEFVRRILGHLNIETTIRFYTALESFRATEVFGEMMEGEIIKIRNRRVRTRRSQRQKPLGPTSNSSPDEDE